MSISTKTEPRVMENLEELIAAAQKKVGAKDEKDLCRFIPSPQSSEGYIHHFTYGKLKAQKPQQVVEMIKRFILNVDSPLTVRPRKRAPRGSKKKDSYLISKDALGEIIQLAQMSGKDDLVRHLLPKMDRSAAKKELAASIRRGEVNPALWACYAELHTQQCK